MSDVKPFQEDFTPVHVVDDYFQSKMFSLDQGEVQIVLDLLKEQGKVNDDVKSGTLLDVGCGCGIATALMAKYFKRAIGVDASPNQITKAIELNHPCHIRFQESKAECLPVEDNSVDVITAVFSVHFMNHGQFIKECKRVLKPGGVAMFYSDLLSGLESLENDQLPVIIDEMTEMNNECLKIAEESSHPERYDLDGFQALYDSINWAGKSKVSRKMTIDSTIAAIGNYYLSYPFYRRLGSDNPMLRSFQITKRIWGMEHENDKDVHVRATFVASVVILPN